MIPTPICASKCHKWWGSQKVFTFECLYEGRVFKKYFCAFFYICHINYFYFSPFNFWYHNGSYPIGTEADEAQITLRDLWDNLCCCGTVFHSPGGLAAVPPRAVWESCKPVTASFRMPWLMERSFPADFNIPKNVHSVVPLTVQIAATISTGTGQCSSHLWPA